MIKFLLPLFLLGGIFYFVLFQRLKIVNKECKLLEWILGASIGLFVSVALNLIDLLHELFSKQTLHTLHSPKGNKIFPLHILCYLSLVFLAGW